MSAMSEQRTLLTAFCMNQRGAGHGKLAIIIVERGRIAY